MFAIQNGGSKPVRIAFLTVPPFDDLMGDSLSLAESAQQ
jgi:hypothetical protein